MCLCSVVVASACVILVAIVIITPSVAVTQSVISSICSQTQNQEICEIILLIDNRTNSADLPLLSLISIEVAMKQVDKNYQAFCQFHDNTTDPGLKISFENCVRIYQNMKDIIRKDYKLSQQKQYKSICDLGKLTTLAYDCENGLPSNSPTAAITEDMLLHAQTVAYTNSFVAGS
ncbi:hypothetical protein Pint_19549 [Pistacia integerrima]|uniref:Uncharacterized protein n=1 Tax=Pistacia integerrima TaxID=434235 RepID=A0ACC0XCJ4_9ROSI|nr:hypothetical protein Pint_19549 [Pistacia integerrima]